MNTKMTLLLAVALVVLASLYYVVRSRPAADQAEALAPPRPASSVASRDLFEEKLGDVVKVVCQRKGGEEWVFEKNADTSVTGQAEWQMISPLDMKCTSYEVTKFGSRLGNLKYELSYKPGQPGAVTAAQAGLDPPEAVVTLTDADDKNATIEIGRKASGRETYVRLGGADEICVAKVDLSDLVKDKPLDYREKRLWDFEKGDVARVEIVDRSDPAAPVSYALSKDGARWMFESPVTAKATSKVDEMLGAMGRLRTIQWHDDDADKLAMYGLEPAALTVRATVEEEVAPEEHAQDDHAAETEEAAEPGTEEPAETEPQKKVTVYELHLSDRSPIGEETKTYLRIGDESAVGTARKAQIDKFKPVMSEWREMRITTASVKDAIRIDLSTPEGSATLLQGEAGWSFDPDGGRAEESAVSELLKAIGDLNAVAFVDEEPIDTAAFGLDEPQTEVRLTIPGIEGVERITVGGYTDQTTKRLMYVRRNDLASVAKVRKSDVTRLIQGPHLYRDRTVIDVLPSRYERIELSAVDAMTGEPSEVTLGRGDDGWRMIEPVDAPVREEQMDKLVEALGGLRAQRVVAEAAEETAYGLHAPAVKVALTYKPPVQYRIEEPKIEEPEGAGDPAEEGDKPTTPVPVKIQPPSQILTLLVTEHDGTIYAKRPDRSAVFEMPRAFYQELTAEYRIDRVLDFDAAEVHRFSIRNGDRTHGFERREDRWVYQAEPDLPLDTQKVENLLLQVGDLRTKRYARHAAEDLAPYGLITPSREVAVALADGTEHVLWVSDERADIGGAKGLYAAVKGHSGVFLLTTDAVERFAVSLDELETPE